jgi:hypothetical protein
MMKNLLFYTRLFASAFGCYIAKRKVALLTNVNGGGASQHTILSFSAIYKNIYLHILTALVQGRICVLARVRLFCAPNNLPIKKQHIQ